MTRRRVGVLGIVTAVVAVAAVAVVAVARGGDAGDAGDPVQATPAGGPRPLFDTHWWLVGVAEGGSDLELSEDRAYVGLRFVERVDCEGDAACPDGAQVTGSDTCNQFGGSVTVAGDRVRLGGADGDIESTLMGCFGSATEAAQGLFRERDFHYAISGDELRLSSGDGDVVLTYRALDEPFGPTSGRVVDEGTVGAWAYRLLWHGGLTFEAVDSEAPGHPGMTGVGPDPGRVNAMRSPVEGRTYLFGTVPAEAARVVYEPEGGAPEDLDVHDVGDGAFAAVGQFVDAAPERWHVVAYGTDGAEIHRLRWG